MNLLIQEPRPHPENTRLIALTKGKSALVDTSDYEWLSCFKWHVTFYGYAATRRDKRIIYMHRLILGLSPRATGDHINGNTLDNRRCNLRPASKSENGCNWHTPRRSKSGFRGVQWVPSRNKWRAYIWSNGRRIHVGQFTSADDAAKARDMAALIHHGEFAVLNLPRS